MHTIGGMKNLVAVRQPEEMPQIVEEDGTLTPVQCAYSPYSLLNREVSTFRALYFCTVPDSCNYKDFVGGIFCTVPDSVTMEITSINLQPRQQCIRTNKCVYVHVLTLSSEMTPSPGLCTHDTAKTPRSGKFDTPRVYRRHLQQRLAVETCSRTIILPPPPPVPRPSKQNQCAPSAPLPHSFISKSACPANSFL